MTSAQRHRVPLLGLFILTLFCGLHRQAEAAATKPNIIVILADDMGFSDIGCYGGEIPTPHIDALASKGLRYTQFYNSARCCPTRASLLTGLYPHQAGVGHMIDTYAAGRRASFNSPAYSDHLNPQTPTIAEVLKTAGYRTLMAGKWHLGYRPREWPAARGFDRSFVMINGAMNYFGYGPQHLLAAGQRGNAPMAIDREPFTPPEEGFFTTDAFTERAIQYIKETRTEGQPFFLYLAHNAPHWPLQARPETIAKYRGKYKAGWDRIREQRYTRQKDLGIIDPKWALAPRPRNLPAWDVAKTERQERWDEWMAVYAAQIEELDTAIGRLMSALRESGQDQNTLVLFLSDNGGAAERPVKTIAGAPLGSRDSFEGYAIDGAHVSSAPFRKTKKFSHEGGISTPLIASWPAGIVEAHNGKLVTEPGHVIDLMATCLELAGAQLPAEWKGSKSTPLEGISLTPTFTGGSLQRQHPLYWEHEGHRAVRVGNWKLVASFNQPWELYDLETDRTEMNDLAASSPNTVRRLSTEYDMWAKRAGVLPWAESSAPGNNTAQ
ncbi:MAG: arylsulfatase [Verrucomicrobiaceae bacterium]|nr:MAG: arylsulfatase [Verrucomicrobiaceae bacterium]